MFAGPGGLNEGFASFFRNGSFPFEIVASIEMGAVECDTLALRGALRKVQHEEGATPHSYVDALRSGSVQQLLSGDTYFQGAIEDARSHVHEFKLDSSTRSESDSIISTALNGSEPWVLVGGPPCQLYSLVGRARAGKLPGFEDDVRHVLYKEYLHIIDRHRPSAFVMENVKGMLSARHREGRIFDLIREDIAKLGYELRSFVADGDNLEPNNFVIHSNEYGVPQRRQRVILFGVKKELAGKRSRVLTRSQEATVEDVLGAMPRIRSTINPARVDSYKEWQALRDQGLKAAGAPSPLRRVEDSPGSGFVLAESPTLGSKLLSDFIRRPELNGFAQHHSRSHMSSDISRYAYYAEKMRQGVRVKVNDLPEPLLPNHKNVGREDTPFSDRFRVQRWDAPSTTVVSHISKDGHYFIHPDPLQARSLTVREAARLQSFPDDYFFCGNRTQQFHQVGNAVPPLLANQIAEIVADFLC